MASYLLAMARARATKRSLSSWTSYKKGLVESGKSCGVLVVSPLHAYAGVFTQTSSVKPNPFANVTIKIDVIFTFKLSACANSVYQAFPPRLKAWVRGYNKISKGAGCMAEWDHACTLSFCEHFPHGRRLLCTFKAVLY